MHTLIRRVDNTGGIFLLVEPVPGSSRPIASPPTTGGLPRRCLSPPFPRQPGACRMRRTSLPRIMLWCVTGWALPCAGFPMAALAQSTVTPEAHLRTGYYGTWGEQRDGSFADERTLQGRLRIGATWTPHTSWSVRSQVAARFSSEQDRWRLRGPGYEPGAGGFAAGDIGMDLFRIRYAPSEVWRVDAGRLRLGFGLPDMMGRGLQRNDGTNISVQWVDGVHVRRSLSDGIAAHVAAFHTPATPTTAFRSPLDFGGGGSRVGWFGVLETSTAWGPVVHRALQVSVLPAARPLDGGDTGAYVAVSAQAMTSTPVGPKASLAFAAEVGWVPTGPSPAALGLPPSATVRPLSVQTSASLRDVNGAHTFSAQLALTSPAWLISSDFRPNSALAEVRYYWRFHPNSRFDVRLRRRQDHHLPADAVQRRVDYDTYVRLNFYLP
jgi:hypothetical protein